MFLSFSCTDKKAKTVILGNFSDYQNIDTLSVYQVEQVAVDLDFDTALDSITIYNLESFRGDPQLYSLINIKLAQGNEYIIKNIPGCKIDSKAKLAFPNQIHSDKIYIPKLKGNKNYIFV